MHKKIVITTLLALCIGISPQLSAQATYVWQDQAGLAKISQGQPSPFLKNRDNVIRKAEKAMTERTMLITEKTTIPPSDNKHDYISLANYWWPNPDSPNGLPYIRHDGIVNPEKDDLQRYDNKRLQKVYTRLRYLSRGYAVSGREDFAKKSVEILSTWFIDPATRMNPNLEFAQLVPGKNTGRGAGIIETVSMIEVLDDVQMISKSPAYTPAIHHGLQAWFRDYADWLQTSKNGQHEQKAKNNHGIWYDAQLASFYHFTGQDAKAREILQQVPSKRMELQMAADGSLPYELARTRPLNYSMFALRAYMSLARLGEMLDVNLYDYHTRNGSGLRKSLDYILPYVKGEKIMNKTDVAKTRPQPFLEALKLANEHYHNPAYDVDHTLEK